MPTVIPQSVAKHFWGDDISSLDWSTNQDYITKVVLDRGGREAVSWLLKKMDKASLLKALPKLNLQPKSLNFWSLYLHD